MPWKISWDIVATIEELTGVWRKVVTGKTEKLKILVYTAGRKVVLKTEPLPVGGWSWKEGLSAQENILGQCRFIPYLILHFLFGSLGKFSKMQTT